MPGPEPARDGSTVIDVAFDMRSDARGKDPDAASGTLRRYHRVLWGKPLPDGRPFPLDAQLHHESELGEFWLRSDSITHSFSYWTRLSVVAVVAQTPQAEIRRCDDLGSTIGGYLVFPSGAYVDGRLRRSINQDRGTNKHIQDRFDLTLECIRRHYLGEDSPLSATFGRHTDFFALFGGFAGYVRHFLLEDLVDEATEHVRFLSPFSGFDGGPLPVHDVEEYRRYLERTCAFVAARNARIARWAKVAG